MSLKILPLKPTQINFYSAIILLYLQDNHRKSLTANQIAIKLNMHLDTVKNYLDKLEEAEILISSELICKYKTKLYRLK